MLEQAIAASNQAEPDLVLLTGDYVTDNPARFTSWYYDSNICKVVLAFMLYWATTIFISAGQREGTLLSSIGIHVLWNEIAYPLGQGLPLVGLTIGRASSK